MVLAVAAGPSLSLGVRDAIARVDVSVWFAFAGFGCFALVAVLLTRLLRFISELARILRQMPGSHRRLFRGQGVDRTIKRSAFLGNHLAGAAHARPF